MKIKLISKKKSKLVKIYKINFLNLKKNENFL